MTDSSYGRQRLATFPVHLRAKKDTARHNQLLIICRAHKIAGKTSDRWTAALYSTPYGTNPSETLSLTRSQVQTRMIVYDSKEKKGKSAVMNNHKPLNICDLSYRMAGYKL